MLNVIKLVYNLLNNNPKKELAYNLKFEKIITNLKGILKVKYV